MKSQRIAHPQTTESAVDYMNAYERAIAVPRAEEAAALADLTLRGVRRIKSSLRNAGDFVGKAFLRSQPNA